MIKIRKKLSIVILILISVQVFSLEQNNTIQNLVNQYVKKYSSTDVHKKGEGISGIQLTVLQNGNMQTYTAGTVGRDIKIPVTAKNLFSWGSITKEFTTAIILNLQEQKKLNLNQTLQYWFPENFASTKNKKSIWPKEWSKVKIFQLLNMTSGIPNAMNGATLNTFWNKKRIFETNWQPNQIITIAAKYARTKQCKRQCFAPGTHWSYSNTNYIIAELIVEKAAKMPFSSQMRELLSHAGVTAYYIPNKRPAENLKDMMHGYLYDPLYGFPPIKNVPLGFDTSNTLTWSTGPASGALIGSTENMSKAVFKLFSGEILSKQSTAILKNNYFVNEKTSKRVDDLKQCTDKNTAGNGCYGLGVYFVYHKKSGLVYRYGGVISGYRSMYIWAPKKNILITVLVNSTAGHNDHEEKFAKAIFMKSKVSISAP